MEEIVEVPARHRIRVELVQGVVLAEQLHADHREYVDHDHQHEGQITKRADRRDDDAEEDFHSGPGLREFQHA